MLPFIFFYHSSFRCLFWRFSISTKWHTMTVSERVQASGKLTVIVVSTSMKIHSQFLADISIRINFNRLRGEKIKLNSIYFIECATIAPDKDPHSYECSYTHTNGLYVLVTIPFLEYFIFKCEPLFLPTTTMQIFSLSVVRCVCCNNHIWRWLMTIQYQSQSRIQCTISTVFFHRNLQIYHHFFVNDEEDAPGRLPCNTTHKQRRHQPKNIIHFLHTNTCVYCRFCAVFLCVIDQHAHISCARFVTWSNEHVLCKDGEERKQKKPNEN